MTRAHHDEDAPGRSPANRLGLDYRAVPERVSPGPIVDVHTHVYDCAGTAAFFEAADLYGIDRIVTMTPLDEVDALRQQYAGRLEFIAIPRWREMDSGDAFQRGWLADLEAFCERGAARMKFWVAPPMRGQHGLTLKSGFFAPLIAKGVELGFDFMVHVGDPSAWFEPGGRYADARVYGTKPDQYPQLEYLLERVAPRNVIAAHMGGYVESPDFLDRLLDRHENLYLDSSATKWVVRGVAAQPERMRAFMLGHPERILFGSDIVVADGYDFEHYASRYRAHQIMWETTYRGESPIEDPDADGAPRLAGLELPAEVLRKLYFANARRLGHGPAVPSET
jgi:predicted TIM-barrel fold metal-dependent hydrolase